MKRQHALYISIFLFVSVLCTKEARSQDIHFSNYYSFSPFLNPALTGNFDGSVRFSAIYRSQWHQLIDDAFITPGASVDLPILAGVLKRDQLGLGLMFFNDISGPSLNQLNAALSLAYHKGIGRESQHRMSLGGQVAFVQWRLDPIGLNYMDQLRPGEFEAGQESGEGLATSEFHYINYNFGVYWKTRARKRFALQTGLSVFNLSEPDESFQSSGTEPLIRPTRYTADLGIDIRIGEKWHLAPDALYMNQNASEEITFGSSVGYEFENGFRKNTSLYVGGRYRVQDAVIILANLEVRNFRVGFAYDITMSDLSEGASNRGGYEISLVYIAESISSFRVNKSLPCRRF